VYERQYKLVKELLAPQVPSRASKMSQTMKPDEEGE
jgi:hypothetical protein